ncbi:glutathione S-transferase N-terminal domain-containing protein [Rhizobium calliandrae]|uniref:Glutathione S-transferase N-terminal domain-containing protein n=1 Tax=Rhizobium calliandrae TaxID=1312182 RepID=A0ABT7KPU6_9HYPH|nr:glutathione S-transferase N-terminal domain-containing protein [Rhizobium calliandrae]MDL2410661.1 glutathione S-transferase N-terminal domain-containing protein [Rhizobium calliandrae]
MTNTDFKPIVYLKENCPFCLKVRLFLLEAGLTPDVEVHDFAPGTEQEDLIRAELLPHLDRVSFPSAQLARGRYVSESDDIVAFLAAKAGRNPSDMPVYRNYVDGAFAMAMALWKENRELKKAASAA